MNTPGTPGRTMPPFTVNRDRTQRMKEKYTHTHAGDTATKAPTTMAREQTSLRDERDGEQSLFSDEMRLFYPDPQATRGAGNNPGLGTSNRGYFGQNDNPNTPFRGTGISPVPNYASRGPRSPLNRTAGPTSPVPIHGSLHSFGSEELAYGRALGGAGVGGGLYCSSSGRAQVDHQGLWVTLFGFPQGYQDGMLKILRDRGEIVEHTYSGTNHLSVKFKSPESVADALGLNGSILPADGLPGENYMIGVKRGAALLERSDGGVVNTQAAKQMTTLTPAAMRTGLGNAGVGGAAAGGSDVAGAGRGPQASATTTGFRGSVGRFLSELLDITDLSIRD